MRRTGIGVLGDIPWGTHLSAFYETKADLLAAVILFFVAGLDSNEFVLWIISKNQPLTREEAWRILQNAVPSLERYAAEGRIEILSHDEWFSPDGAFDPDRTAGILSDKLAQAKARGLAGLRLSGSSAWLQSVSWKKFLAFEHALHEAIVNQSILALCTFPLATSGAAEMLAIARTHDFIVAIRDGLWETVEIIKAETRTHSLTAREIEALQWAALGKTAWKIGKILRITKRTVDEHTQTAVRKLGAANKSHAVAIALLRRIITARIPTTADATPAGRHWREPSLGSKRGL
jgi:DNA-binding CsgD family transcriptional regulator